MIDRSKLGNYASELFDLIVSRHPDWVEIAKNVKFESKLPHTWDEVPREGFEINIPCPTKGNPPLIIEFYFPEEDLFTIGFGPTHIDCYGMKLSWHPTVLEVADKIDTVIKEIYSENLISACWKFLSSCAFINLDEYKAKLERGKITVSVSWRGTYNYNYNGEQEKTPNE